MDVEFHAVDVCGVNPLWPRKPIALPENHGCPGNDKYEPHCSLQSGNKTWIMLYSLYMYGMATGLSPVCRKDGRHWRINALHTIRDNNVFSPTQNGNL